MNKKTIIILTTAVGFILLFFYYKLTNFDLNSNRFEVTTGGDINIQKLKVYKGEVLRNTKKLADKIIYENGKTFDLKTNYGENDFLFVYADSLCCTIRYIKTNDNMIDVFYFHLNRVKDKIFVNFKVEGTDDVERKVLLKDCK
jgi:hypothetical protein